MRTIKSILMIAGFVLAAGTAFAAMAGSDPASLLNTLDPSKVPGYVDLETGVVTAEPKVLISDRGSAAGGIGMERDTFLNYIDPSKVAGHVDLETGVVSAGPKAFIAGGSAAGGMNMEHDTFLNYITN